MQRLIASLFIATSGGIGLFAFAAPIEAGGGGHGGCMEQPRESTSDLVEIVNYCFTPAVLHVEPGTTVTWTNEDQEVHNVTFFDGSRAGDDPDLYYRNSVSATFDAPGLYAYYCSVHPMMLGVVAVGDPAGFAISQPSQQPEASPPAAPAVASAASGLNPTIAGLVVAVGIVSAGGGYLLRRRVP